MWLTTGEMIDRLNNNTIAYRDWVSNADSCSSDSITLAKLDKKNGLVFYEEHMKAWRKMSINPRILQSRWKIKEK